MSRLRDALRERRVALGTMIMEFGTRGIAKILERTGVDFALIDMEHSGFGIERVADLVAWFKATPITPIVRIPQPLYHFIAGAQDVGMQGVMVANVETAEAAQRIVDHAKYPPQGHRGIGLFAAHSDYGSPKASEYLGEANARGIVIAQIESAAGLANVEGIAAVEGIDILWVGHNDLSTSMGISDQFESPRFLEALDRVVAAARKHGKAAAAQPGNPAQTDAWMARGFSVISLGSDGALYREALRGAVNRVREQGGMPPTRG